MIWKPPLRPGLLVGGVLLLVPLLAAITLAGMALTREFDLLSAFMLLPALALLVFAALVARGLYGLFTLSYVLDHTGLVIRHGGERHVLPLDSVEEIIEPPTLGSVRVPGLSWSGYKVGIGRVPRMGRARFYITTERPGTALIVRAGTALWVISPQDPQAFIAEWEAAGTGGEIRRQRPPARGGHGLEPRPLTDVPPAADAGRFSPAPRPAPAADGWAAERSRPTPIYPLRSQPAETSVALTPAPIAVDDEEMADDFGVGVVSARALPVEPAYPGRRPAAIDAAFRADALDAAPSAKQDALARASEAIRRAPAPPFADAAPEESTEPVVTPFSVTSPLFQLAAVAVVLNLALWVFVAIRYPALASLGNFPIQPNPSPPGSFSRSVDPIWAFYFPLMGAAILAVDLGLGWFLRDRDRLLLPLLVGAALFLQAVVWVASIQNLL